MASVVSAYGDREKPTPISSMVVNHTKACRLTCPVLPPPYIRDTKTLFPLLISPNYIYYNIVIFFKRFICLTHRPCTQLNRFLMLESFSFDPQSRTVRISREWVCFYIITQGLYCKMDFCTNSIYFLTCMIPTWTEGLFWFPTL